MLKKRFLVTGSRGFIASHMIRALQSKGHEVTGIDWQDSIPFIGNYDWVIHMGGISSTTETNVEKIIRHNYDYSNELLTECFNEGVNFQFSSSASVYGLKKEFKETSPVDPRTPYAWSKYIFELQCMSLKEYLTFEEDPVIQVFRYFNVYGDGEEHKGTQASPFCQFKQQKEKYGKIKVFKDSYKYVRDFIPVEKVIDIHMKFFDIKESGVWNVGTGKTRSFLSIAKQFGVPLEEIDMPENLKNSYQEFTCADTTKLNDTLNRWKKTSDDYQDVLSTEDCALQALTDFAQEQGMYDMTIDDNPLIKK